MIKFFLLLFFYLGHLSAAETDGFTNRYESNQDALPLINIEINQRMNNIVKILNQNYSHFKRCDWDELHSQLGKHLRWPLQGQIEKYITDNGHISKSHLNISQSVYKNLSFIHFAPMKIGTFLGIGFTPPIYYNGLLIGADKFGHFLDEGYYYYHLVNKWNYSVEEVLDIGIFSENYLEGKLTGGVYSFADLAANYDGYLFWTDLLGPHTKPELSKFFSCHLGIFKMYREIDLSEYVNAAWDEGMNCNEYRSEAMKNEVEKSIIELEAKNQKRFHCPVYVNLIGEMINRYGPHAKKILSPVLFIPTM